MAISSGKAWAGLNKTYFHADPETKRCMVRKITGKGDD